MKIGNREFDTNKETYVVGILNVTPDSFFDGGKWNNSDGALKRVEEMISEGADMIDIGGESTRPGYAKISDNEEISRLLETLTRIKSEFDIPISVDTYKSEVATAALLEGADFINDIWGLKYDDKMASVIAKHNVPCCLMHNRKSSDYCDFMTDMKADLKESIEIAKRSGIAADKIVLDPGIGFAKSHEQNLEAMRNLAELNELNCPILLGTSRKSVIGNTLKLPVTERLEGTIVTTVFAVLNKCSFVRVHDIKENKRAIAMAKALIGD